MMKVHSQFTMPATAMALGRGPWRNSSDAIIMGMGPVYPAKIGAYWQVSIILLHNYVKKYTNNKG